MAYTGAWLASVRARQDIGSQPTPDAVAPFPDEPLPPQQVSPAEPPIPDVIVGQVFVLPAIGHSGDAPERSVALPGYGASLEDAMWLRDAQSRPDDMIELRSLPDVAAHPGTDVVLPTASGVYPPAESHLWTDNGTEFPHRETRRSSEAPLGDAPIGSAADPLWDRGIVNRPIPDDGGVSAGPTGGLTNFTLLNVGENRQDHQFVGVASDAPEEAIPVMASAGSVSGLWGG